LAQREGLTFLGSLPVDTELVTLLDASSSDGDEVPMNNREEASSFSLLLRYNATPSSKLFEGIVEKAMNSYHSDQVAVST